MNFRVHDSMSEAEAEDDVEHTSGWYCSAILRYADLMPERLASWSMPRTAYKDSWVEEIKDGAEVLEEEEDDDDDEE